MANKGNVTVGKPLVAGAVYRAPVGTTLPTAADATLDEAFAPVGYISDEGLRWSYSGDGDVIRAWGRDVVARPAGVVDDVASFQMLETVNEEAVKAFWGDDARRIISGGYALQVGVPSPVQYSWVIDMLLPTKPDLAIIWPNPRVRRIVIPMASVRDRDEISYQDSELVAYGVSLKAGRRWVDPPAIPLPGEKAVGYFTPFHYEYVMGPVLFFLNATPPSNIIHPFDSITLTIDGSFTTAGMYLERLENGSWTRLEEAFYRKNPGYNIPIDIYLPRENETFESYGVGTYRARFEVGTGVAVYQFEVIE